MLFNKFSGLEEIVDATVEDYTLSKEAVSDRYQLAVQVVLLKTYFNMILITGYNSYRPLSTVALHWLPKFTTINHHL